MTTDRWARVAEKLARDAQRCEDPNINDKTDHDEEPNNEETA